MCGARIVSSRGALALGSVSFLLSALAVGSEEEVCGALAGEADQDGIENDTLTLFYFVWRRILREDLPTLIFCWCEDVALHC